MTAWPVRTLGDLCREGGGFIRTGPFGSQLHQSDYVDDPNGIPVVMPKDMSGGRIDRTTIARINAQTADRLSQHLLAANDVVLSRRGDVGRSAWVFANDLPAFCGTGSMRVHPGTPVSVRAEYLRYFFRSRLSSDYLEGHAVGATMPNLNATIVESLPVPVLPAELQDAAVAVLGALDELIENNRRRVEVLEQMARAIYREWFVRFHFPGHENVEVVDSEVGLIPVGWEAVPASAVLNVNPRVKVDKSVENPFFGMADINERSMVCAPSDRRLAGSGSKFENGDTLFARITPCLENGKTGYVQVLSEGEIGLGSTEFIVLRGRSVGPAFAYCLARSEPFRGHAIASMSGASGRQRVRNECFDSDLLAQPPADVAATFEEAARPLFEGVELLRQESIQLEAMRDRMLPKLVTGQIDVSSLDLDSMVEGAVA
jgi:type I restriction enzyme, S subunit